MNLLINDSQARYQDRLNEAEEWRRAKRARANRASQVDRLRALFGDRLIALGQYVKAAARPAPQFD